MLIFVSRNNNYFSIILHIIFLFSHLTYESEQRIKNKKKTRIKHPIESVILVLFYFKFLKYVTKGHALFSEFRTCCEGKSNERIATNFFLFNKEYEIQKFKKSQKSRSNERDVRKKINLKKCG